MILVSGSLAYDQIMNFPGRFSDHILPDKIHQLNVSFLVNQMKKGFGGTAGNIAYSLSLLGIKCAVMGIVGSDFTPYREFLEKNEVDTTMVKTVNNLYTSTAFGITDRSDNQIWGFYTGADSLSDHLSIDSVKKKIDFAVIAPHNPRAMVKFAQEYRRRKIPYLFDPGMQLPWLEAPQLSQAIKGARIVIGNDYEIALIKNKTGVSDIVALGGPEIIIITTMGDKGSQVRYKGTVYPIAPARVVDRSDPTGAGDAYRAGFLAGFMRGFDLTICGQMGSVAASYTVEKYGTTTHKYTLKQFSRRYYENYRKELNL